MRHQVLTAFQFFSVQYNLGKTSYCSYWEEEFKQISKCKSDQYSAFRKACNKLFTICGSERGQVKFHHGSKKHLERLDKLQNTKQRTFTSGQMTLTKSKWRLTQKENMLNAEILQVLHIAQYNISFLSTTNHAALFQQMFPDSLIAASYKQSYTKVSYILKFGIAAYL